MPQQRLSIQKQMNTGVAIDHFIKDSISLDIGSLDQKRVPVVLRSTLSYETGYDSNGAIKISPDSVTISGPESILDTILSIDTEPLVKSNLNESFDEEITVKKFNPDQNIRIDIDKVLVKASIEKFTEGTQKVSFTIKNLPDSLTINTFPKEIEVIYKVALTNFNNVNASSFVVECDFQLSAENNLSYLVPRLIRKPDMVKNVKLTPSKIDFVIEK